MKHWMRAVLERRMGILGLVLFLMSAVLMWRFYTLQIVEGENWQQEFADRIEREQVFPGSRGMIYDRNGRELAYNELTYAVTIEDNGDYETRSERNAVLNRQIELVLRLLEEQGDESSLQIPVELEDGEYRFTADGNRRLRFLADIYGHTSTDDLTFNERLGYDERQATAEQVMEYLCSESVYGIGAGTGTDGAEDRAGVEESVGAEGSGGAEGSVGAEESGGAEGSAGAMDPARALQIAAVRYAMGSNSYRRYIQTTMAEEVSEKAVAAIQEHNPQLPGVDIARRTVRRYTDSKYFAHILGYTGPVSEEELESLTARGLEADRNDVVGKAGIERAMEQELHGRNGAERFYVDHVGRVTEILDAREASTGNNLYLTIDAKLQMAVYDLLEQKLAGILLANIVLAEEPQEDHEIPVREVYEALIDNHVIDTGRFTDEEAQNAEQELGRVFALELGRTVSDIRTSTGESYGNLDERIRPAMDYVLSFLEEAEYYQPDGAGQSGDVYQEWQSGTISLEEFLEQGIIGGWIHTENLVTEGPYSLIEENVEALKDAVFEQLPEDPGFQRLIYRLMLQQHIISGEQICMVLLEQGVVSDSGNDYERLQNGNLGAYGFIREKIRNLEITPAQLALDPCTASSVVVDPDNGEVLACVTYPGYDNNRLANSIDGDYYNRLLEDASLPLYNNATQQRTAPGSTFKPITVAAGLTEGVITPEQQIEDLGSFELITPSPRCWIHPSGHGSINVLEALRDSCNYYFYTIGYEMSLEDQVYQEEKGTETLRHYSELFGLNETTGIEITESEPQMADGFPVTAAIGQSNHNYTTSQLARYAATLANRGTLYDLTLIDRIQDGVTGEIQEVVRPSGRQLEEITPEAWDTIAEGMRMMAEHNRVLGDLPLPIAGKTGTAQQNRLRPNHALFVGYAPYEQPQIAVATRIAYGYSSSNAVEVTADIFKYYFHVESEETLLTGQAEVPENSRNSFAD